MAARRLILFAVLGATLLVAAALVGVLAFGGAAAEDDASGPALRRPTASAPGPELPQPVEAAPGTAQPVAPKKPGAVPVGPNVIVARVVDDESGAPILAYTVKSVPHDGGPALPRLADTPGKPEPMSPPGGIFHLECAKGRWDVVVQAAGYLPGELSDVAIPRPDNKPLELRLSHGPSITGLVFDDNNLGVQDVPVFLKVQKLALPGPPPAVALTRTDDTGRFRFSPLPAGVYTVAALEPESDDHVGDIALDRGTAEVAVFVAPRHQLVASVRDTNGNAVADAEVELRAPGGMASQRTNAAGQARLRFLKPGHYDVRVSHAGFADSSETLDLVGASGEIVHWYTLLPAP